MLNINMKKALIAGAVLTAICTSAFAAEQTGTVQQPSMRQRVAAILNNDCPPECPAPRITREQRGQWQNMTPEQRAEAREKFRRERQEQIEKWQKMTPEERQAAMNKIIEEQKKQQEKIYKEKLSKLTPEQRAEVEEFVKTEQAQRQERHEKLIKMTPEQREAVRASRPRRPHFFRNGPKPMKRIGAKGGFFRGPAGPQVCPEAQQPAE